MYVPVTIPFTETADWLALSWCTEQLYSAGGSGDIVEGVWGAAESAKCRVRELSVSNKDNVHAAGGAHGGPGRPQLEPAQDGHQPAAPCVRRKGAGGMTERFSRLRRLPAALSAAGCWPAPVAKSDSG